MLHPQIEVKTMYATTHNGTNIVMNGIGGAYLPSTLEKLAEFERKYTSTNYDRTKKPEHVSSKPKTGIEMYM
jgi:hypothetical protein